jgi:hypothetical protein
MHFKRLFFQRSKIEPNIRAPFELVDVSAGCIFKRLFAGLW